MILSISDIKKEKYSFLIFSIFLLVFGIVYEHFSHGVYSIYMCFAFLIPLILGYGSKIVMKRHYIMSNTIYDLGVITITFGSIFKGVLDIYGTTNKLLLVYPYVGFSMVIIGTIIYFIKIKN